MRRTPCGGSGANLGLRGLDELISPWSFIIHRNLGTAKEFGRCNRGNRMNTDEGLVEVRPAHTGRTDSAGTPTQGCASLPLGYLRLLPTGGAAPVGLHGRDQESAL